MTYLLLKDIFKKQNFQFESYEIKMKSNLIYHKNFKLSFDRFWSSPEYVEEDRFIAVVLARPVFEDVLKLCVYFGIDRVVDVYKRLVTEKAITEFTAKELKRMLKNIEEGYKIAQATRGSFTSKDKKLIR
ncbi:MAG: hypothetical protein LWW94_11640 [Candidatus Desulfofervidaceae bacterium]|nr:hypothetical protein [Candidatus Desulfofervidaceae bacterium]